MWLRGLVAVTCLAVLAAIGWWFWSNYSEHQAQEAAHARALASECRQIFENIKQGRTADYKLGHVMVCLDADAFSIADMRSAGMGRIVDQLPERFID